MKRIRDYVLESGKTAESGSVMIAGSEIENFIKKHEAAGGALKINDGIHGNKFFFFFFFFFASL
ncbi:hypothetical protein O9992_24710 [Vibrio lentus]|nr:hypothetical protein [Vibrio lentus]